MRFEKIFNLLSKRKTAAFDLLLVLKAKSIRVLQVLFHICSNPTSLLREQRHSQLLVPEITKKSSFRCQRAQEQFLNQEEWKCINASGCLKFIGSIIKGFKKKSNVWSDFEMWAGLRTFQLTFNIFENYTASLEEEGDRKHPQHPFFFL